MVSVPKPPPPPPPPPPSASNAAWCLTCTHHMCTYHNTHHTQIHFCTNTYILHTSHTHITLTSHTSHSHTTHTSHTYHTHIPHTHTTHTYHTHIPHTHHAHIIHTYHTHTHKAQLPITAETFPTCHKCFATFIRKPLGQFTLIPKKAHPTHHRHFPSQPRKRTRGTCSATRARDSRLTNLLPTTATLPPIPTRLLWPRLQARNLRDISPYRYPAVIRVSLVPRPQSPVSRPRTRGSLLTYVARTTAAVSTTTVPPAGRVLCSPPKSCQRTAAVRSEWRWA